MSAAADEFAALQRSQIHHLSHHPSDASTSDNDIDTYSNDEARDHKQIKHSIRSGKGRSGGHDEDEDEDNDGEDDDDWDARYGGNSAFSKRDKGYQIPKGAAGNVQGNTGPKGVIADARAAEHEISLKQGAIRKAKENKRRNQIGVGEDEEMMRKKRYEHNSEEKNPNSEDSDGDEAFMREWRRKRMEEAGVLARNGSSHGGGQGNGKVDLVDALAYLEAVDGAPRGKTVVVYIHDAEVSVLYRPSCPATLYTLWSHVILFVQLP